MDESKGSAPKMFGAIDCPTCDHRLPLNTVNTVVRLFTKQRWFNHLLVVCDHCGMWINYWTDQEDQVLATQTGCGLIEEDYCDDERILEGFAVIKDLPLVHTDLALTPRLIQLVEQWSGILEATSAEDILFEMAQPQPQSDLPTDWC